MLKKLEIIFSEEKLRVFDYLSDWIRIIDIQGNILFQNLQMIKMIGDHIGKNCLEPARDKDVIPGTILEDFNGLGQNTRNIVIGLEEFMVKSSIVMDEDAPIAIIETFRNVTMESIAIKRYQKITQKTQKELNDAREIQKCLLPETGDHRGLDVSYKYIPSEYLSGDMFDVIPIDDTKTAIYIADVVAHGISASILTMFVRQSVRYHIARSSITGYTPDVILRSLIRRFGELNLEDSKYFTIFYGVFDKKKGTFSYANAGHNAIPLKINKDGEVEKLKGTGLPISLITSKGNYSENIIDLKMGEKILFYTDGITETKDYFGEFYGTDRLMELVSKNSENILDKIVNEVSGYRWGRQEDDIALLLVERKEDENGN